LRISWALPLTGSLLVRLLPLLSFLLYTGLAAALTSWTSRSPSGLLTAVLLDCVVHSMLTLLRHLVGILGTSSDVVLDLRLDPLLLVEPSGFWFLDLLVEAPLVFLGLLDPWCTSPVPSIHPDSGFSGGG
jgi:hypothetical protein